ncbi:hypothetical protein [Methanobrevibacter wolinii]|uniref:hypothetical protein n=1 Tax=Methanobrevibacter wolinii TaxID=190977 RepID=UPI0005B25DFC|nr:hypothetical protein [Methanobrevibacter wolinii]MDD5960567.1 hypothetical protein [Methanobrevibacter wolinii]
MKCNSCIFRKIIKNGNKTQQICGYTGIQIDPVYSCENWQLKPRHKSRLQKNTRKTFRDY